MKSGASNGGIFSRKDFLHLFFLLVFSFIAYFPSLQNGFNNWDDVPYITGNPYLELTWSNIFHSFIKGEYHPMYLPLTALSHSVIYHFSGMEPFLHHLVNVLIHLANISLVFIFIQLLLKKREQALFVAFLFAIHTMQVESVSYVAGRRDILYSWFFLLTLILYLQYLQSEKRKFLFYALLAFIGSLLSKGQAVMLPLILVAIDWFRSRPILSRKVILEKVPFFLLSLISGLQVMYVFNTSEWVSDVSLVPVSSLNQVFLAAYGFIKYCWLLVVPAGLSIIHPYPDMADGLPVYFWFCMGLVILFLVFLVRNFRTTNPIMKQIVFGLLFFSINISLVLQLISNSYSIVNEHYVYLASIGWFILPAALYEKLMKTKLPRIIFLTVFSFYGLFLFANTFNRSKAFKDSITVWTDALKTYPDSHLAYYNMGVAYKDQKEHRKAMECFTQVIELKQDYTRAYGNRGAVRVVLGDYKGAVEDFTQSLSLFPVDTIALFNRGNAKSYMGDYKGAIEDYNRVIELRKIDFEPLNWRGKAEFYSGDLISAIRDFDQCVAMGDTSADVRFNRGSVFANASQLPAAIADFDRAIELNPRYDNAYLNRGLVKVMEGDKEGGCSDIRNAVELGNTLARKQMEKLCGK